MSEQKRPRRTRPSAVAQQAAAEVAGAARWVHIDELVAWERNPRLNDGDNQAVAKVAESIRMFGFIAPVVVWKGRGRLVAGHTRIKALRKLLAQDASFVARHAPAPGMVPVREIAFASQTEADAYSLADNRLGEIADWDEAVLSKVLVDLKAEDFELDILGWPELELKELTLTADQINPGTIDDQGRLDQLDLLCCPHCSKTFRLSDAKPKPEAAPGK